MKAINKEFRRAFLEVEVKAVTTDAGFNLKIDRRDVDFDNDLDVLGAGTYLG